MADSILYNENCMRAMKRLTNGSIDLILTDLPYNLGTFMKDRDTNLKKMRDNFFGAAGWDDLSFEEWEQSMDDFFEESARVLKKGGAMLVFMSVIKVETLIRITPIKKVLNVTQVLRRPIFFMNIESINGDQNIFKANGQFAKLNVP